MQQRLRTHKSFGFVFVDIIKILSNYVWTGLPAAATRDSEMRQIECDNTANVQTVSFLFVVRGYNRHTDQLRVDWPSRGGDETTKWGQIECNKTANVQTVSFLCVVRRYNHNTDQLRVDWPSRGGDAR